ncbi:MAG: hypothetical protein ABI068_09530 [Ktedonobacterales bacterium]
MPQLPLQQQLLIDLIALAVVGYLAVRQFREKQVRINTLWVLPALLFLFSYNGIQTDLFDTSLAPGFSPIVIGLALLAGLAAGAVRGALIKVKVDISKHILFVKGTPFSVILWIVFLALKALGDVTLGATSLRNTPFGTATGLTTAALLTFSLGALIATRVYFYWRYSLAAVQHQP